MQSNNDNKQTRKRFKKPNRLIGFNDKKQLDKKETQDSNVESNITPIARVSIMGRPNVGKSSLFNRLHKQHIAITSDMSGSTRDINKKNLSLKNFDICLIDTGGLEITASSIQEESKNKKSNNAESKLDSKTTPLKENKQKHIADSLRRDISWHSYNVIKDSDVIIYMVDGSVAMDEDDKKIFHSLRKKKPVILVLNKIDSDKIAFESYEFASFGIDYLTISIKNNRGITKLLETLESTIEILLKKNQLKKPKGISKKVDSNKEIELDFLEYFDDDETIISNNEEAPQDIEESILVSIIGRPNVGKSSLLNALTLSNRSLVSDIAGTTIDPVNESILHNGRQITFVDTAGIRRRSRIEGIEKYALDRTQKVLKTCHIAILVLDSSVNFVELDEKISALANNNALGVIVVLNKWDIRCKEFEELKKVYLRKFRFLEYAPMITASALTKRHIHEIKEKIIEVYNNFSYKIPTAKLNQCIERAVAKHPIPSDHGKFIKIYYATQFETKPPRIALIMNKPTLHFSYKRYLINTLRDEFNLFGIPIILELRSRRRDKEESGDRAMDVD